MRLADLKTLPILVLLAIAPAASGQGEAEAETTETATLAELKSIFQKEMHQAVTPAARLYIEELQKLERGFAASGRYEAAMAVRDERQSVSRFLGNTGAATTAADGTDTTTGSGAAPKPEPNGALEFEDAIADISEGAEFNDAGLALRVDGATASWGLGAAEPGGYEIVVEYSAKEDAEVQVKESFFRITGKLPTTGGKTATVSLGTLKITGRSDAVSILRKGDGELPDGLIIHAIKLISAKD